MSKTIPLNLDINSASALYILIDAAIASLSKEKAIVEDSLKADPKKLLESEIKLEILKEMDKSLDEILKAAKGLSVDIGEIVSMFDDEQPKSNFLPYT